MPLRSQPVEWEVAVGPAHRARYFHVPDEGLHEFLRSLVRQGIGEFHISNGRSVFRISRVAPAPRRAANADALDER